MQYPELTTERALTPLASSSSEGFLSSRLLPPYMLST